VFTQVGFLAPALVFEHTGNRMFFANSDRSQPGVRVFDAANAEQLTTNLRLVVHVSKQVRRP